MIRCSVSRKSYLPNTPIVYDGDLVSDADSTEQFIYMHNQTPCYALVQWPLFVEIKEGMMSIVSEGISEQHIKVAYKWLY